MSQPLEPGPGPCAGSGSPWHLGLVGGLSFASSAFGVYDYLMVLVQGDAYAARLDIPAAQIAFMQQIPPAMRAFLALGVFASLLASALLLLRRGLSVSLFALAALVGIVGTAYIYGSAAGRAAFGPPMLAVSLATLAVSVALAVYAKRLRRRGILR